MGIVSNVRKTHTVVRAKSVLQIRVEALLIIATARAKHVQVLVKEDVILVFREVTSMKDWGLIRLDIMMIIVKTAIVPAQLVTREEAVTVCHVHLASI